MAQLSSINVQRSAAIAYNLLKIQRYFTPFHISNSLPLKSIHNAESCLEGEIIAACSDTDTIVSLLHPPSMGLIIPVRHSIFIETQVNTLMPARFQITNLGKGL